jgi:poly(3-hydroxybutyrate) depolymerase
MYHRWFFFLALSNALLVGAQTVSLHGTVSSGGQPVTGAAVTLMKMGLTATTGADGSYSFSSTAISHRSSDVGTISLSGGALEFGIAEPSPVAIEVFDIKSNRLKSVKMGVRGAGLYHWNIPGEFPANQLLIIRASVGKNVSTFRYLPVTGGMAGQASLMKSEDSRGFAKSAAVIDSLEVKASGYATKVTMVESYDAKVDVSINHVDNGGDRWGGLKNPPAKSAGCGKPATITTALRTIQSGGKNWEYWTDMPANYDPNTPSRVIFIYHWSGGTAASMKSNKYYGIQPLAAADKTPTIFVAPTHGVAEADDKMFLDLLAFLEANLCVDTTRIFSTGYSLGGMITYSLSTSHQNKLRAAAGIAPANYNLWLPNPKIKEPIAWWQMTGMSDETCRWINNDANKTGSKYIALEKAADNGCTIPAGNNIPTWTTGNHLTYEFTGCKTGYPVVVNTFNGPHGKAERATDPGASSSWVPTEIWAFFKRF